LFCGLAWYYLAIGRQNFRESVAILETGPSLYILSIWKTSNWVYFGMALAAVWVAWYLIATTINTYCHCKTLKEADASIYAMAYGRNPPTAPRVFRPSTAGFDVTGDYLPA
jgi:hypothetical protein